MQARDILNNIKILLLAVLFVSVIILSLHNSKYPKYLYFTDNEILKAHIVDILDCIRSIVATGNK